MTEVVIVDAVRTPIGALGGKLASVRPDDLAAFLLQEIVRRNHLDPLKIDDVYLGCANQAGEDNRNIARMAVLLAGYPPSVPGVTINRLCASGLSAVNMAYHAIASGETNLMLAGGVESMSRAPYSIPKAEKGFSFGNLIAYDTALGWRYPNPRIEHEFGIDSMGETAENIAAQYEIKREAQDGFAVESHRRAIAAQDSGRFDDEIVAVKITPMKGETIYVKEDERPRRDSSLEKLGRLNPSFRQGGTVTAGNSSGLNDGASVLILASAERANELGLKPMARLISSATAGIEPRLMGLGPIEAVRKALNKARLEIEDIHLAEINEAFAVQVLAVMHSLGLAHERVNVNGGAIALGHPLGCSGARILTTLLHEMKRRSRVEVRPFYGLATLCVGVGQGEATIVEWIGN